MSGQQLQMISCSSVFLLFLLLNYNGARVTGQNYSSNQPYDNDFINFIAYGRDYDKHKHPYVVSLIATDSYQCTGTLLKPTFVLTAAHCTWGYKADDIAVIHGAVGVYMQDKPKDYGNSQRVGINIWQHEKYHDKYNDWPDIAMVEVNHDILYN
ncbi:brain-specific serine protease 4-like [Adelges cooleyi]|uniref:brain-specific serine protease 4-like n=1 Tax=Adelges cooleyi TaxID=133065 RepID=UPI00217F258E|nr:brain-specific serine protease 4-like [Adelges cooleyi]